jgi:putative transposase
MPNHIHVVFILKPTSQKWQPNTKHGTVAGSLSAIVQAFKASVGLESKARFGISNVFQRGFHEHVIRDEEDLYAIRKYIRENPLSWELDKENPNRRRK